MLYTNILTGDKPYALELKRKETLYPELRRGMFFKLTIFDALGWLVVSSDWIPIKYRNKNQLLIADRQSLDGCVLWLSVILIQKDGVYFEGKMRLPIPAKSSRKGTSFKVDLSHPTYAFHLLNTMEIVERKRKAYAKPKRRVAVAKTTRPNQSVSQPGISYYEYLIGTSGGLSQAATTYVKYARTWTGTRTPNFGKLQREGRLPVNNHSVTITEVQRNGPLIEAACEKPGNAVNRSSRVDLHTLHYAAPAMPSHDVTSYDKATKRLIAKAGNQIDANLAQDLAQFGQIIRLVDTTTKRLVGAYHATRRNDFTSAIDALWDPHSKHAKSRRQMSTSSAKTLAENWLELQYGWKPLLMDIRGLMESVPKLILADRTISQVTASATTKSETTTSVPLWAYPSIVGGKSIISSRTTTRIGLRYRVDDHTLAFLAQSGFTNPINLAWEVLPFSFVADWLLPIGPFLEAISAWQGLVFLDGFKTQFTKQRAFVTVGWQGYAVPTIQYDTTSHYVRTVTKLDRTKLTTFPVLPLPRFKNPLSVTHALNGIALVVALFSSKGTYRPYFNR